MNCKDCKCKICKNIEKGKKDIKESKVIKFKSIDEWEKMRKIWQNMHPIRYKLQQIYYAIWRFFVRIIDFFKYGIKYFIQRGRKGWSGEDWWNLPFYISKIMVDCLKKLKKEGHGLPTWEKGKAEKQAIKEWNDILDNIIYTFEMATKIGEGDIDYISTTQKDAEKMRKSYRRTHRDLKKKYPELPFGKVLTAKESEKLEKGFDLFKKWFFHLWD